MSNKKSKTRNHSHTNNSSAPVSAVVESSVDWKSAYTILWDLIGEEGECEYFIDGKDFLDIARHYDPRINAYKAFIDNISRKREPVRKEYYLDIIQCMPDEKTRFEFYIGIIEILQRENVEGVERLSKMFSPNSSYYRELKSESELESKVQDIVEKPLESTPCNTAAWEKQSGRIKVKSKRWTVFLFLAAFLVGGVCIIDWALILEEPEFKFSKIPALPEKLPVEFNGCTTLIIPSYINDYMEPVDPTDTFAIKGNKSVHSGYWDEAYSNYIKGWNQGSNLCAFNIGLMYQKWYKRGAVNNKVEAAKWYELAANKQNKYAQYNLAHLYCVEKLYSINFLGIEQDLEKAKYWFKRSAKNGYAEAQTVIGMLHERGIGYEKSDEEAKRWYMKASMNGSSEADVRLAQIYKEENDYANEVNAYLKGAKRDNSLAIDNLMSFYYKGYHHVNKDISQLVQYLNEKYRKYPPEAGYKLAALSYNGLTPYFYALPESEIIKLIDCSAVVNTTHNYEDTEKAREIMALIYCNGYDTIKVDYKKAIPYLTNRPDSKKHYILGCIYLADGELQNYILAEKHFRHALKDSLPEALNNLGCMYISGKAKLQAQETSLNYFIAASRLKNPEAAYNLSLMYEKGITVDRDKEKSRAYRRKYDELTCDLEPIPQ